MKNKKGITFGRVLLYILFGLVFLMIIWVLVLTYREIANNPNTTTKIDCDNTLRLQNENDIPVNLYNYTAFPFFEKGYDGNISNYSLSTGAFTFLKAGTYTISFRNYDSDYACRLIGYKNASYVVNVDSFNTLWTNWISFSSSYTFTLNVDSFLCLYSTRYDSDVVNLTDFADFDVMLNEGSTAQNYIPYNQNYQNANSYISDSFFTGDTWITSDSYPGGIAGAHGYFPIVGKPDLSYNNLGSKTTYFPSSNINILDLGKNVSDIYTRIYNSTYSCFLYSYSFNNISYQSTTYNIFMNYECSTPIPVYLFNFDLVGSDLLYNSNCFISFVCNDNIEVSVNFSNLYSFDYNSILAANPNIRSISSFGFTIYINSSINPNVSSSSLFLQNNSWSTYKDNCYFYLVFKNYFGNNDWTSGYQEGFREGQNSANEALQIAYDNAIIQVNDLISQVNDLTSRVNSQSSIIDSLQNQINNANLGFKNFFFTMADVPFKTVSNVLGFEVFGLNLFQFFTGILTALGCIWLIKKFL